MTLELNKQLFIKYATTLSTYKYRIGEFELEAPTEGHKHVNS